MISGKIPGLIPLRRDQISVAADILTSAFKNDPKIAYLFSQKGGDHAIQSELFRFELTYTLRYGWVYTTPDPMRGVALWLPSEKSEITTFRGLLSGGIRLQRKIGKEAMNRVLEFSHHIDQKHMTEMPYFHLYLFVLGVHPDHQNHGVAGRLIRPVLDHLEKSGIDCFLTTQNEENIGFYEHFGFEILSREYLKSMQVPVITMKKTGIIMLLR
ncbi:GNAT family N-acetyltransferase [Methanospirillum hungatei]|uniref:GNAT family N-acetyltransferase n=1 Tax=Methanospirillum hungatei TaxID=2203 RepID=UPI0026E94912|nr:GNAT family N-acetyltransferase [Methanospirillum hungatei]MCA1917103.1 GNAT family N-acetyltransferase [Methanospirillum hungatei]